MHAIHGSLLAAFLLLAGGIVDDASACDDHAPCTVEGGDYLARPPVGWDGKSPLPTVVFFHGYSGSAEGVMADADLARAMSQAGVLLVAPQGMQDARGTRTWSFPGAAHLARDDFAFVGRVVDDVEKRWPVDTRRLLASGFSVGGSMVWYIACRMPQRFAGFAPVAGAFWVPEPEDCPGGPVDLRHVHGLADQTVPMKGRSLRNGTLKQGDVLHGMTTWRRIDGCPDAPSREEAMGALTCRTWSAGACSSGRELVLCLHPGEHEIEAGWVLDGVRWLDDLASRRHP
jgi:polyhydroxybutyrate depolymerase